MNQTGKMVVGKTWMNENVQQHIVVSLIHRYALTTIMNSCQHENSNVVEKVVYVNNFAALVCLLVCFVFTS